MSLTNYQKVAFEFNNAFGVQNNITPQPNLYSSNPDLVKYRLSLINEEVKELDDAIHNKDFKETEIKFKPCIKVYKEKLEKSKSE